MTRTYRYATEKRVCDEGIPVLLFPVRESVREFWGLSPFELFRTVSGHEVGGPRRLLKENSLSRGGDSNIFKYVMDFGSRPTKACELTRADLNEAQDTRDVV